MSNIPQLTNLSPTSGATDVSYNATVAFDVTGDLDVDPTSVVIRVNGVIAWTGDAVQPGFTATKTSITNGYHYSITGHPSFPSFSTIPIRVVAFPPSDPPDTMDTTFSFQTVDYVQPLIDSIAPLGLGVAPGAHIQFSIKDTLGTGVDLSSVQVTINSIIAVQNGAPISVWAAGSSVTPNAFNGFDFDLVKDTYYDSYHYYTIHITANDLEIPPNTGTSGWSFRTQNYLGPLVHPVSPQDGQVGVAVTSNIVVEVTDAHLVTAGSIRVRVDRGFGLEVAYQQGDTPEFKSGWDGPASVVAAISGGYRVTIDPTVNFPVSAGIEVDVLASDPEGNPVRLG